VRNLRRGPRAKVQGIVVIPQANRVWVSSRKLVWLVLIARSRSKRSDFFDSKETKDSMMTLPSICVGEQPKKEKRVSDAYRLIT
jgi:hypothetical protein